MYVPTPFEFAEQGTLFDMIEQHPFGLLISAAGNEIEAAHIPFLADRRRNLLQAHVARANPIWKTLRDGTALAVFTGPHAYISPDWYGSDGLVPTWNYLAVHASGPVRLLDGDETATLLERLTERAESGLAGKRPWTPARLPADRRTTLMRALVGFEIAIERLEGKAKLSQNRSEAERKGVVSALNTLGGDDNRAIAALMATTV